MNHPIWAAIGFVALAVAIYAAGAVGIIHNPWRVAAISFSFPLFLFLAKRLPLARKAD